MKYKNIYPNVNIKIMDLKKLVQIYIQNLLKMMIKFF